MRQAGDHLKCPAESARDVTSRYWRQAAAKAQDLAAAGGSAPELPPYPRHYTCEEEASIATTFLVGMDEVARIVYWVCDARQRCDCCPNALPSATVGHPAMCLTKDRSVQRPSEDCLQGEYVPPPRGHFWCFCDVCHAAVHGLQAPAG